MSIQSHGNIPLQKQSASSVYKRPEITLVMTFNPNKPGRNLLNNYWIWMKQCV